MREKQINKGWISNNRVCYSYRNLRISRLVIVSYVFNEIVKDQRVKGQTVLHEVYMWG